MLVLEKHSKLSSFWVASDSLWVEPLLTGLFKSVSEADICRNICVRSFNEDMLAIYLFGKM